MGSFTMILYFYDLDSFQSSSNTDDAIVNLPEILLGLSTKQNVVSGCLQMLPYSFRATISLSLTAYLTSLFTNYPQFERLLSKNG